MRSIVFVAVLLAGCGVHAQLGPPRLDVIVGYGRRTDCPGQPLPVPLPPEARRSPPGPAVVPVCSDMEVGTKLAPLLAAIVAVLAL